jgi:4a-hydroxytetrahydrobiopterin dehydratase
MKRQLLTQDELTAALETLDGWTVDSNLLRKEQKFANFAEALAYVNRVGELAEAADHHPDITFGWGYAKLALTTHDRSGITDVDLALAKQIDTVNTE